MYQDMKSRFTQEAVSLAAACFGVGAEELEPLGFWQNAVFGFEKDGEKRILRVAHDSHRGEKLIADEIDFLLYLSEHGARVSPPLPSPSGRYVESIRMGGDIFHAACFRRAFGREWEFSEKSTEAIGEATGLIHSLSRRYGRPARYHWFDNGYIKARALYIPQRYGPVLENARKLLREIHALPRTEEDYGLIHGDINGRNYLVGDDDEVTLFDFDECQMDWYANDVAIQLFYYTYVFEDVAERAEFFLQNFLRGYRKHAELTAADFDRLPLFLRLRELIVFTGVCRGLDLENLNPYTRRFVDRLSLMGKPLYLDVEKIRGL